MRRLLTVAAALLLAAPLVATALPSGKKETTIKAVARPGHVRVGQIFTVEVRARHLRNSGAISFHLVFDPGMVEPVSSGFTEGPALRRGGARTSFLAAPATTGDRVILGLARLGESKGASGGGLLCRLTFRALSPGPVAFAFDRARVTTPDAAAIGARFLPGRMKVIASRPGRKK